jgi:hypothetical protein
MFNDESKLPHPHDGARGVNMRIHWVPNGEVEGPYTRAQLVAEGAQCPSARGGNTEHQGPSNDC